ncbi:lysophospholipase L1-like esterase [Pedobacter sp. UYP24]
MMALKKTLIALCLLVTLSSTVIAQAPLKPFKKGERVVFAGNSITEAGLYGAYIWLYYMTRFPDRRIEVMNAGVGGDVAEQIYARLDGDILKKKPTVLAITFGMNDSKYFEYLDKNNPVTDQKRTEIVKVSYDSYVKIEKQLKALPNLTKILMASSPYDETAKMEGNLFLGKSKTMQSIVDFQLSSAKENNWGYVDFFHPMTEINQREQKTNPAYTNTGTDRIHPGGAGHFIMAYLFLKDQGLANSKIADVSIDASKRRIVRSANSTITSLTATPKGISFNYLAKSLPYPIDTVPRLWMNFQIQTEAMGVIPFVKEFDQELLTVTGLKGKTYQITIDGNNIGSWSADDLAKGINLATVKSTPQYHQALKIMALNNTRREIESKFRNYYWVEYDFLKDKGLLFARNQVALDTIQANVPKNGWLNVKKNDYQEIVNDEAGVQKKMTDLVDEIYKVNQPIQRKVVINEL